MPKKYYELFNASTINPALEDFGLSSSASKLLGFRTQSSESGPVQRERVSQAPIETETMQQESKA